MIETVYLVQRCIGALLTLYMMAICLRWLGPYIEVEVDSARLRPIAKITDPPIRLMRDLIKLIGPMGPVDWGPIAALMAVWLARIVLAGY